MPVLTAFPSYAVSQLEDANIERTEVLRCLFVCLVGLSLPHSLEIVLEAS